MNTTLFIMASGIGSRFGTGIKQLEPIGADFNHVLFIIRKDIEKEFKEVISYRIAYICSSNDVTVYYAFQDINNISETLPVGRTKSWGTGQAVLAAKNVNDTSFNVSNADVYYGKEGFKEFFEKEITGNPLKAEYLIATFIGQLLEEGKMSVKVLRSDDTWYGMIYKEDVVSVKDSFKKMLAKGVYRADLYADLKYDS